jgi:hypothetical protein
LKKLWFIVGVIAVLGWIKLTHYYASEIVMAQCYANRPTVGEFRNQHSFYSKVRPYTNYREGAGIECVYFGYTVEL